MKVTVDTNFLISATQWDYSVAHKILKNFILSDAEIFTTQDDLRIHRALSIATNIDFYTYKIHFKLEKK